MKSFFSILITSLLFISCSKEKDIVQSQSPEKKLKKIQYENNNWSEYGYDANGKLVQQNYNWNGNAYYTSFTHSAGKIAYLRKLNTKKDGDGEYTIVNGRPVSLTWTYYDANENPINTFIETFEYNQKGLLVKRTGADWHYTYVYDANNNLTEQVYYANGQATDKSVYTYHLQADKYAGINGWWDDSGKGLFFPPKATQLLKSIKSIKLSDQSVNYEYNVEHQLDAGGYAVSTSYNKIHPAPGGYLITYVFE